MMTFEKFVEKVASTRVGRIIVKCLYHTLNTPSKIKRYFRRDAFVRVEEITYGKELKKAPYSFNIYVVSKGKCARLWSDLDWSESGRIIDFLKSSEGTVILEMSTGIGTSSLLIPKWAKPKIIKELEEYGQDSWNDYQRWINRDWIKGEE
ncbi:hypothetical protein P4637_03300 [Halalkalibacterium halodurans]|uniref:hypothetical protein n=1 Tax=Halalkalibacterium halodurans TaxID=86665 RepID=UPI002E21F990|nr:hypothetical protein [Halalkalibacterium halodurans]MED4105525.1 hypothetical protein [Halalkalibacterium halodurans]MED4109269.1 hypothetical protein [Halalkalibacterium halodurans]MED4149717.1 hypothetical protein [Halalkalibacterium halodurans]